MYYYVLDIEKKHCIKNHVHFLVRLWEIYSQDNISDFPVSSPNWVCI